jgi:hypothetical protein
MTSVGEATRSQIAAPRPTETSTAGAVGIRVGQVVYHPRISRAVRLRRGERPSNDTLHSGHHKPMSLPEKIGGNDPRYLSLEV